VDCIIATRGYDFRKGQVWLAKLREGAKWKFYVEQYR
jgi:hypothetical protein